GGSSSSSSLLIRSKNPRRCQAENPLKLLSEFAGPALLRSDATQAACIGNTLPEGAARQSGSTQALYMVDQINRRMSCDLRSYHANALGITGPQMMILMALTELEEDGVPVNAVAKLMRVESGFITKQSRELEVSSSCAGNPT
ncbi:hypothetical protein, partial [Bradyrhizobium sp. Mp27]